MFGTTGAGRYRALLSVPVLRRTFVLALVGRLGYAVLPLCLLFTIAQATRSFAIAATATGLFGAGGLVMPAQARLLDRFGQRRVLGASGVCVVVSLIAIAVLAIVGCRQAPEWYVMAAVAGASAPALGPSMRAQWRALTSIEQRPAAYSLDSVAEEVVFLVGPVIASGVLATGPAWRGVLVTAVLVPVGVAGLTLSPAAAPPPGALATSPDGTGRAGPWRRRPFVSLLGTMLLAGAAASAPVTTFAAMADDAGRSSTTGVVEAAAGLAAVAGGLWWGRRPGGNRWWKALFVLLLARVPALIGCAVAPYLWSLAAVVVASGFVLSPLYVVAFTASDEITEPDRRTEASTWVTSLTNTGVAAGTAAAGWLFARGGTATVAAATAVTLIVAAGLASVAASPARIERRRRA